MYSKNTIQKTYTLYQIEFNNKCVVKLFNFIINAKKQSFDVKKKTTNYAQSYIVNYLGDLRQHK